MKAMKKLLALLMVMCLFVPFIVNAETKKTKEPVKVYLFRSTSCGYCQQAMEFFASIEEEYGSYFDLMDYEVSSSQENSELMEEVAKQMKDDVEGVPYMVIGKESYSGFNKESMEDMIKKEIMTLYESNNRYDVIEDINNKPDYSVTVLVVSLAVIGGIVAMAVVSRKNNK